MRKKKIDKVDYWKNRMVESRITPNQPEMSPGKHFPNQNDSDKEDKNNDSTSRIDSIAELFQNFRSHYVVRISTIILILFLPYIGYISSNKSILRENVYLFSVFLLITLIAFLFIFLHIKKLGRFDKVLTLVIPAFVLVLSFIGGVNQSYINGKPIISLSKKQYDLNRDKLLYGYFTTLDERYNRILLINENEQDLTSEINSIINYNNIAISYINSIKDENFSIFKEDLISSFSLENDAAEYSIQFMSTRDIKFKNTSNKYLNLANIKYNSLYAKYILVIKEQGLSIKDVKNA